MSWSFYKNSKILVIPTLTKLFFTWSSLNPEIRIEGSNGLIHQWSTLFMTGGRTPVNQQLQVPWEKREVSLLAPSPCRKHRKQWRAHRLYLNIHLLCTMPAHKVPLLLLWHASYRHHYVIKTVYFSVFLKTLMHNILSNILPGLRFLSPVI